MVLGWFGKHETGGVAFNATPVGLLRVLACSGVVLGWSGLVSLCLKMLWGGFGVV